jgi:hypothetical protein
MFAPNSSFAQQDQLYVINQGSNDVIKIYGAFSSTSYFIASYKRKLSTGDVNRDSIITDKANRFCFIYGNGLAYSSFAQP